MKMEYSDFYKFIASAGITLISLAVLVPWLFYREPSDLLLNMDDISKLTPLAQTIIQNRQLALYNILLYMPYFSIILFLLGIIILGIGGWNWFSRTQNLLDEIGQVNLEILKNQLPKMSSDESAVQKEEEAKANIEDEVDNNKIDILKSDTLSELVQSGYRVEKKFADKLRTCYSSTHDILTERRLGAVSFDIVLLDKTQIKRDYIFEIKYIRQGFKFNFVRDNVFKIVYANQLYESQLNRKSMPVLMIIGPDILNASTKERYEERIRSELTSLHARVILVFLTENELSTLGCDRLKNLLKP